MEREGGKKRREREPGDMARKWNGYRGAEQDWAKPMLALGFSVDGWKHQVPLWAESPKDLSSSLSSVPKPQSSQAHHFPPGSFSVKWWDRPDTLQGFFWFSDSVHSILTQATQDRTPSSVSSKCDLQGQARTDANSCSYNHIGKPQFSYMESWRPCTPSGPTLVSWRAVECAWK